MAPSVPLPQTMRAAQWRSVAGGIEKNLKTTTEAKLPKNASSLPKDHTLVRVAYASLNHLENKFAEAPLGSTMFTKPATPGLDFSGTVVATKLDTLRTGQRVFGRTGPPACGTLAEYVVVGKEEIAALPAGVSLRDAACVGVCGVTAVQTLAPFVKSGSKVLINGGSGGVGTFAIQVAKVLGCSLVTVVASRQNADMCRDLGADEVIDHKSEDVLAKLKEGGQRYDHVLDAVFVDAELYWQCHEYLKPHGTYVSVGLPIQFKTFKSLLAIRLLPGFLGGGKRRFRFHSVTPSPEHYVQVAKWIEEGKMKVVIEEEFDLEDAGKGYARLKGGRTRGKLLVRVCGEGEGESDGAF